MRTIVKVTIIVIVLALLSSCQYEKSEAEEIINMVEKSFSINSDGMFVLDFDPVDGCIVVASPYSSVDIFSECGPVPLDIKKKYLQGDLSFLFLTKEILNYIKFGIAHPLI